MSCTGTSGCTCGCCSGVSVQTPQIEANLPGQSAIVCRAGTWSTFKESMLARLSSSDYPALGYLKTRDDDDFTIAFLDATSIMLDILTFYQERLANESYLRTAQQRQSLIELSRLIGYQPSPGVAASAYVAFTLKAVLGQASNPSNPAITIPQGSQMQSVPAQGQAPQTFETSGDIPAKSDWNALPVQSGVPWIAPGAGSMYLSGTATQLNPGDSLLILGVAREMWQLGPTPSEQWDVVVLNQVRVDNLRKLTYVAWDQRLLHESGDGTSGVPSTWTSAKIFAFRTKAALFGNNAPDPNLFASAKDSTHTSLPALIDDSSLPWQWNNFEIASSNQIDLDAAYSKVTAGSWFALASAAAPNRVLVLGTHNDLWLEPAPIGSQPASARIMVDKHVRAFQALDDSTIFVLGTDHNLWLEHAPFGSVPPNRQHLDGNVKSFQAISATQVFVLGTDGNLWLEQAPFGSGIPSRAQVDTTTASFQAMSASQAFILGTDGKLWLAHGPFGAVPPDRVEVDDNVQRFQATSASFVFLHRSDGSFWFIEAPFGSIPPSKAVDLYSSSTQEFQALSESQFFILSANDLVFVQLEPNYNTSIVQSNVKSFHVISSSAVLFTDTSNKTWLATGPGGGLPSNVTAFSAISAELVPCYLAQLFKVQRAHTVSLAKFGLSAKVTELAGDYADPGIGANFGLQPTQVWAQSERLDLTDQPLTYPLYGSWLDLEDLRPDLAKATVVAISGSRQKIIVADGVTGLTFVPDDGSTPVVLKPGDTLTITAPSPLPLNTDGGVPDWGSSSSALTLYVEDSHGRTGTLSASLSDFTLGVASSSDPEVSECALIQSVNSVTDPYPHTRLILQANLLNCYDRTSAAVNANVALATHGQSVAEIMGNGSASTPNQSFALRQSPLTFVQAPTPTGCQSTLQVKANGIAWTEVPSLYQQSPSAQVFATLNQPGGVTTALFGDGVEGAVLPTGQNNIQTNYRIGSGAAGNVAAGAISTLIDRPLGVSGVTNPQSASGGQDPDSIDGIRANAPQTVMTLGRAVSIDDYESYSSTFAGIAKASALWIPSGPARGVFITVAGVGGAALQPGNPTLSNLAASLRNYGNPLIPIIVTTFLETLFSVAADLQYAPNITTAAAQAAVQAQVLQALYSSFGFAQRTFGQAVSADEVATVIQTVTGVVAVNVKSIQPGATSLAGDLAGQGAFTLSGYNNWLARQVTGVPRPASDSPTRICPYVPIPNPFSTPLAAEILVIDPDPKQVVLGVMS